MGNKTDVGLDPPYTTIKNVTITLSVFLLDLSAKSCELRSFQDQAAMDQNKSKSIISLTDVIIISWLVPHRDSSCH